MGYNKAWISGCSMAIGAISCFSVPPKESGKQRLQIRSCDGTLPDWVLTRGAHGCNSSGVGEGACQLLSGAVQVCRDSLHSAPAVIKAVADVARCDWCSHRGHSKPGVMVKAIERLQQAENCGAGSCCKYGGAFCYVCRKQAFAFWVFSVGLCILIPKLSAHCFFSPVPCPVFTSKCNLT